MIGQSEELPTKRRGLEGFFDVIQGPGFDLKIDRTVRKQPDLNSNYFEQFLGHLMVIGWWAWVEAFEYN